MAITYGNVYVAQVALGANSMQTIKAIDEAERYLGHQLSLVIPHVLITGSKVEWFGR